MELCLRSLAKNNNSSKMISCLQFIYYYDLYIQCIQISKMDKKKTKAKLTKQKKPNLLTRSRIQHKARN